MKKRKINILLAIALIMILSTSVFASAHASRFTWHQSTGNYYVYANNIPGTDGTSRNNDIRFYANVYSPRAARFDATLQKRFLFMWYDIKLNPTMKLHQTPNGWIAAAGWWSPEPGDYRVKLHSPTIPQETVFTNVHIFRRVGE